MENNQNKSQLQQANEILMQMASNITTSDRQEALVKYSEFTVVRYLKGKGTKLDTAMNLIAFFKERIEKRNSILKES